MPLFFYLASFDINTVQNLYKKLAYMLETIKLPSILFLDVETVSGKATFSKLNKDMQKLWETKAEQIYRRTGEVPSPKESYIEKAGIFAEFGKIVCISVGFISQEKDGEMHFRLKSFYSDDEAVLLTDFAKLLQSTPRFTYLCGHNIKEFDIPYICRRMVINQLAMPGKLQIHGKKPWELNHFLDTLELWKFGDYKNYTSLNVLCNIFGVPTPKDDMDGSQVGKAYWKDKALDKIAEYCQKDVLATAQVFLKFVRKDLIKEEHVHVA